MKIAIVVNSFPALSETFIFNKVHGLIDAGFDVTVYTGSSLGDVNAYSDRFPGKQVKIKPTLPGKKPVDLLFSLFLLIITHPSSSIRLLIKSYNLYIDKKKVAKAFILALPLKLGQYDLIHFEFSGLAVEYLDALPLLRPSKLLTSCRGSAEQIAPLINEKYRENLYKVIKGMDYVHCVSFDMQQTVANYGLTPQKSFINYPSIDVNNFTRRSEYQRKSRGPYYLISVGRLHWKKGVEFALLSVKELINQDFDIVFKVIGGGPEEDRLRFITKDLGISDCVQFLGRQNSAQVKNSLESADIFLLPSISEGLSNAVLEAMAMELPIVATDVGGMCEAVDSGVEGFLVPPYQPKAMAEKIAVLLQDQGLRLKMGAKGRQRVITQFEIQKQVNQFIEVYNSLFRS